MTSAEPAATCEPPTGTALGTPHWLTHPTRKPIIAIWQADHRGPLWYIGAASGSAFALAELGYRYVCPCPTPEQIAEREADVAKLKIENQELRERLRPHDEKQFRDWGRIG